MAKTRQTELDRALDWYNRQQEWLDDHGGCEAAYVERYGSVNDEEHYGDGGEAIFAADMAALERAEARAMRLLARANARRAVTA